MTFQQFALVVGLLIVFRFLFDLYRINNRVLCRFTGRDNRVKKKWAKLVENGRVEFNKGWYYILTRCLRSDTTFFGLLPVTFIEFSYKSKWPISPETGEPEQETPEMRKNLNKREDIQALEVGSQKAMGGVKVAGVGGGWLPIALVIGIVVIIYLMFQMRGQIDMLGQAINVSQELQLQAGK